MYNISKLFDNFLTVKILLVSSNSIHLIEWMNFLENHATDYNHIIETVSQLSIGILTSYYLLLKIKRVKNGKAKKE